MSINLNLKTSINSNKMIKRQNIRTLFLIVTTFTYLLFGASVFDYTESKHEIMQRTALNKIEEIIIKKYNISQNDFRILTTVVIKNVPHKAGVQWKFSGAFYFATTVLTTIGYGHSTPATYAGKTFCMLYALFGIPVGLITFQSIGERLNTCVKLALRYFKRYLRFKEAEGKKIREIRVSHKSSVIIVSIISTLMMTIGAAVFSAWENWTYFDAFYYCFITLTTIGFGDYVALQKNSALQDKPEYVIFSLVFILFGLSVVSAAINLLILRFITMNTEDERRDVAEAALQSATGVRLEGDVITANGSKGGCIIQMENYYHNAGPLYFNSRYHYFSKGKFRRSDQLGEDDLFTDHDSLAVDELNANVQGKIAYHEDQKPIELPDSESCERTSQRKLNNKKRRKSKVFSKTTNNLLSKQQRKNYKHMISEDESEPEKNSELMSDPIQMQSGDDFYDEDDDRASVCSCTCYGNNQSISSWRSNKTKRKNKINPANLSETKNFQTFALNRDISLIKRHKIQSSGKSIRSSSNIKYKNLKPSDRRMNQAEYFDLNQSNEFNHINQMQNINPETILRPIYFHQMPYPATNQQVPLIAELPLGRAIFLNNSSTDGQPIFDTTANSAFILNKQRPFMVMQSNWNYQPDFTQPTNEDFCNPLTCNLDSTNDTSNQLNLDHVSNQLNAIHDKNVSHFIDDNEEKELNVIQSIEQKRNTEMNEKQFKDKSKIKKRKIKPDCSEYFLKHSDEGLLSSEDRQLRQFCKSELITSENEEVKNSLLSNDHETKQTNQRASI